MIRVIVADDHYLVRQGVRNLLETAEDIEVIGEAENGQEALELVEQLRPDVVVMDVSMPEMNGIKATQMIRDLNTEVQVVILSMYGSHDLVQEALNTGAIGYLLKRSTTLDLVEAVRAAKQGRQFLSNGLSGAN
ncbi:MAG: response regulator transcription factor [Candidatus Promineifilaceae bacterium]|nr:response regulator transcription factor [Candidatus Promineifilaceae bacterium]